MDIQPTLACNENFVVIGDEGSKDAVCYDTQSGHVLCRIGGTWKIRLMEEGHGFKRLYLCRTQ